MSVIDAARLGVWGHEHLSAAAIQTHISREQHSLACIDGIITPSTYAADSISRDLGYPRNKIIAVGGGSTFYTTTHNLFARERYASGRVLFIGRDWIRKGGPLLLAAMDIVKMQLPHVTLHVVGPPKPPAVRSWLVYYRPINKATPAGLTALMRLFLSSALFCMPTTCEPWGLVFSEAAECGLPIVGINDWSLPDIVLHGETGLLCDLRDPEALATLIVEALDDPDRCMRMGEAARARSRSVLDWPHVTKRLLSGISSGDEDDPPVPLR